MGYSGMATAFLAVASEARGQVISTDLDPDALFNLPASQVDLDGDGVIDFRFYDTFTSAGSSANHGCEVNVPIGNGVIASPAPTQISPSVLVYGSAISSGNSAFTTAGPNPISLTLGWHLSSWLYGNWYNPTTGFIGVHFVAGDGETHYGWIQLAVAIEEHSYVLAYGYESMPNEQIAAGATGATVGLTTAPQPILDFVIAPNPISDRATISLPNVPADGWSIQVLDPLGRVVITKTTIHAEKLDVDLQSLAPGTYFVRLDDGVNTAFRKVVKR
jgi:hypothetical protein